MPKPSLTPAGPLTGAERVAIVQGERARWTVLSALAALLGPGPAGKDGLMRSLKRGTVTTPASGEALITYPELGLTSPPVLAIDPPVAAVPVRWRFKTAPTAVAAVVVVTEDKPAVLSSLGVTVAVSGGQPSPGAVVGYRVYPPETP